MVALVGSRALVLSAHEPAKVPVAVDQEVLGAPPGLNMASPPGLDAGAAVASTQTLRDAVRQLGLENKRLQMHLCPDVARLRQENEELRAMLLTSCAHYGVCVQAPPQAAQQEWTGGEFVPASQAGFAGAWPMGAASRRRRRGCRGGARSIGGKKLTLRDGSSEVSTEEGQPSERFTTDSLRDDSDLELVELEDEGGDAVELTVA